MYPVAGDIKQLPLDGEENIDAIYSRSSLHVSDIDLQILFDRLLKMLKKDGYIMIEGKTIFDPKIKASRTVADNLVRDSEGHVRRIWDRRYILDEIIKKYGLRLVTITQSSGKHVDKDSQYINFIAQKV